MFYQSIIEKRLALILRQNNSEVIKKRKLTVPPKVNHSIIELKKKIVFNLLGELKIISNFALACQSQWGMRQASLWEMAFSDANLQGHELRNFQSNRRLGNEQRLRLIR